MSNLVSGANIQILLNLLPQRIRVDLSGLSKAVLDERARRNQYKTIKEWIWSNKQNLLMQGIRTDETNRSGVALVADNNGRQIQQKQGKWSDRQLNNHSARKGSSGQQSFHNHRNGNSQTINQRSKEVCGFCDIIKEKRPPRLTHLSFEDVHRNHKPGQAPYPTNCL